MDDGQCPVFSKQDIFSRRAYDRVAASDISLAPIFVLAADYVRHRYGTIPDVSNSLMSVLPRHTMQMDSKYRRYCWPTIPLDFDFLSVINLIAYDASIGGVSSHTTVLDQS